MDNVNEQITFGWLPEVPDIQDYSDGQDEIKGFLSQINATDFAKASIPATKDLRVWCSRIENQGSLGSCTAQAGVALFEYYQRKAFGTYTDASRLFLYKVTRKLLGLSGDTGAYIRTTMGAMRLFGAPPEKYWPYTTKKHPGTSGERTFDEEPSAFCYQFADNYKALSYFKYDIPGVPLPDVLKKIKYYIAANLPAMFGFTVYSSICQASKTGKIPFPCRTDRVRGGHAVVAVGYDDKLEITNSIDNSKTKGAFLIRNSWGSGWGDSGYGWLPYQYVLKGLARDWWTLFRSAYVKTKEFGF